MREEFTDTLRYAMTLGGQEARMLNQEFVGTEHLMLGLLVAEHSEVCTALDRHEISAEKVARTIRSTLPKCPEDPVVTGNLPLSPKAKRMVTDSLVLAQREQVSRVSTRHLMQAILNHTEGLGPLALRSAGMDIDELCRLLSEKPPEPEP